MNCYSLYCCLIVKELGFVMLFMWKDTLHNHDKKQKYWRSPVPPLNFLDLPMVSLNIQGDVRLELLYSQDFLSNSVHKDRCPRTCSLRLNGKKCVLSPLPAEHSSLKGELLSLLPFPKLYQSSFAWFTDKIILIYLILDFGVAPKVHSVMVRGG